MKKTYLTKKLLSIARHIPCVRKFFPLSSFGIGMKLVVLLLLFSFKSYSAQSTAITPVLSSHQEKPQECALWLPIFRPFCHRLKQTWTEGSNELYLSGYAWHNRLTYSADVLREKKYNELAWGGGFGKGFFDEKGNWHGLYAFAFLDSHRNLEPIAGYAYLKVANLHKDFKAGLGFSVFITSRPDIIHNIPFPGIVPWAGLFYKKLSGNCQSKIPYYSALIR
jgi:palmitoyl transferase